LVFEFLPLFIYWIDYFLLTGLKKKSLYLIMNSVDEPVNVFAFRLDSGYYYIGKSADAIKSFHLVGLEYKPLGIEQIIEAGTNDIYVQLVLAYRIKYGDARVLTSHAVDSVVTVNKEMLFNYVEVYCKVIKGYFHEHFTLIKMRALGGTIFSWCGGLLARFDFGCTQRFRCCPWLSKACETDSE